MADLNEVRLIGRLTRDPELRSIASGTMLSQFGIATSRKFKGGDGELREEVTFVDVTCWGKLAENVSRYMKKGSQLFVGGRLKLDTWEDKQTGGKRSKLSVVAENVQFLDNKRDEGGHQRQTPPDSVTAGMGQHWDDGPDMGEPPF